MFSKVMFLPALAIGIHANECKVYSLFTSATLLFSYIYMGEYPVMFRA